MKISDGFYFYYQPDSIFLQPKLFLELRFLMKANQPLCFVPVFEQYHRRYRHDSVFSGNVLAVVYHKFCYLYLAYAVKYQLVYYRSLRCACASPRSVKIYEYGHLALENLGFKVLAVKCDTHYITSFFKSMETGFIYEHGTTERHFPHTSAVPTSLSFSPFFRHMSWHLFLSNEASLSKRA